MPSPPTPPRIPSDPITVIATLHGNLVHLGRENALKCDPHNPGSILNQDNVEDYVGMHEDSFADVFGMEIYHALKRKLNRLTVRNGEARARVRLLVELEE